MKTIAILHDSFCNPDIGRLDIGGVETYIDNLINVCNAAGYRPVVFQMGNEDKTIATDRAAIVQLKVKPGRYGTFARRAAARCDADLAVYATERIIPRCNPFRRSIAVQHGIFWDIPRTKKRPMARLIKSVRDLIILRRIARVDTLVCVDHNFPNWLRAETDRTDVRVVVIPNFAHIPPREKQNTPDRQINPTIRQDKPTDRVNLIFARRLWPFRGTRVFTDAITIALQHHPGLHVTIAGDGPDLDFMHKRLDRFGNVTFTTFAADKSPEVHALHHIAVVPTIGSEGTSLALLEAMAAGCAVIATPVGGITDIVTDNFNGLYVEPGSADDLARAICRLADDAELRNRLAAHARETVVQSFGYDRWATGWRTVLAQATGLQN